MKKISLKNINLSDVEQLSREQLKNVMGGSFGFTPGPDPFTTTPPEYEDQCYCEREDGMSFYLPNPTGKPCHYLCG